MWGIYWRDLKRILTNPVAIIVTVGIAILPSLYAWLNIISNWDPYANTQNISIAVANLDSGAHSDITGDINVGDQLVAELKTNNQLGWNFVKTQDEALEGVYAGTYYAVIVVNKDFSQELVDMLLNGGDRPELQYYVNEKLNPIAPKITDAGATTLDRTLNSVFVGTVTKAVSEKLKVTTDEAQTIVQGAHHEAIEHIDDSIQKIETMRNKASSARDSLNSTADDISDMKQAVSDAQAAVDSAQKAADQASSTAQTVSTAAQDFTSQTSQNLGLAGANLSVLGIQAGQAGTTISSSISTVNSDITDVSARLSAVIAGNNAAISQIETLLNDSTLDHNSQAYQQLSTLLNNLETVNKNHSDALNAYTTSTQQSLTAANQSVTALATSLGSASQSGSSALTSASSALGGSTGQSLISSIDSVSSLARVTSISLGQLSSSMEQSQTVLNQLQDVLHQTADTVDQTSKSLDNVIGQLSLVRTDMAALDSSKLAQAIRGTNINADAVGSFMQSPVQLVEKAVYPVENYGSAIAPFFTSIALWVGGFALVAVMKIEIDRKNLQGLRRSKRIRDREAYMGRWLLFMTVGVAQGVIATVGDIIIGIQLKDALAFVFAGIFASIVFVSLIYALAATFKHIGKALAVVLVIIQISGSSGTYPIEIMPEFFQKFRPWLPFTYSIGAMRETIGGYYDHYYWKNMGMLSLFLVFSLVLGLVVRPYMMNLNALFDRRLADTDLLVGERAQGNSARFRLSSIVQTIVRHDEFGRTIRRKALKFGKLYPKLVAWGLIAIGVIPAMFLVLLFTVEAKIVFLMLWVISIALIDFYLISLEYIREIYERELGMSTLSPDALRAQVLEKIAHRWAHNEGDADGASDEGLDGAGRHVQASSSSTTPTPESVPASQSHVNEGKEA
ncbi:YhgE/Pip family protein [Alloscardovia criceti]|uniref:YhgE/Pip family protein n=1 Tax=Alloscardovia criceti TaxID=356828 RepID=UPI00037C797C|nr:YhgE/Pip domain-containing protein [Alloscardovia criceti]